MIVPGLAPLLAASVDGGAPIPPSLPMGLEIFTMSLSSFFGAIVAANRRMPAAGIVIAGLLVGLGGGIVRDLLLNTMPFSISQWSVLPAATLASVAGGLCARQLEKSRLSLIIIQAITLGLLVVIGAEKAIAYQVPPLAVIVLGVVTACAGGAMLDALCGQRAALLSQGRWHVTALIGGAVAFLALDQLHIPMLAEIATVALVLTLRVISHKHAWSCPVLPGSKAGENS